MASSSKNTKNFDAQEASTSKSKWNKPESLKSIAKTYMNKNQTELKYKPNVEKASKNEVQAKGPKKQVRFCLPENHHDTEDKDMR